MSYRPLIGGALSHPAERFPSVFGNNEFLRAYPYFLPCAIPASFTLICLVITYVYLKEVRIRLKLQKEYVTNQLDFHLVPDKSAEYRPILPPLTQSQIQGLHPRRPHKRSRLVPPLALPGTSTLTPAPLNPHPAHAPCCVQLRAHLATRRCVPRAPARLLRHAHRVRWARARAAPHRYVAGASRRGQWGVPGSAVPAHVPPLGRARGVPSGHRECCADLRAVPCYECRCRPAGGVRWRRRGRRPALVPTPIPAHRLRHPQHTLQTFLTLLVPLLLLTQLTLTLLLNSAFSSSFIYITASAPPRSLRAVNGLAQTSVSFARGVGPALASSLFSASLRWRYAEGRGLVWGWCVYGVMLLMVVGTLVVGFRLPERPWAREAEAEALEGI